MNDHKKDDDFVVNYETTDANNKKKGKKGRVWLFFPVFGGALLFLFLIFYNIPTIDETHKEHLKIPTNLQEVKMVGAILHVYTVTNYYSVLSAYCAVYIFLQAFSIPGSIFLSFLAGALFGVSVGVLLVCACSTIGATCSYLLSAYISICHSRCQ